MLNEESLNGTGNVSVDILEFSRTRDVKMEAKEDPDATESSSSFGDTTSGNENTSGLSDAEVNSQFFGDSDLGLPFDGFSNVFPIRKKKLTAHWRNFVQPLMWRCKWTELKIKELEAQASRYARELSSIDRRKNLALDQITGEQSGSKSMPFIHQSPTEKLVKRRKRKRVEDTTDLASYMANHILFSERENKRADLDGAPISHGNSAQSTNGHDEYGFHDDDDNLLEQILGKIELVHSRVNNMKAQLDSVMTKNAVRFSSSENLSQLLACDVQTSSVRGCSPTVSACNGDTFSVGGLYTSSQNIMDYDIGDFMMPDGAVSSFGEAFPIPDIIESTVGLLSSIDVTQHHPHVGDSSEKIVDNILIQNETADQGEGSSLKYDHKAQEAENSGEEETTNAILLALEPDTNPALKSGLASEIHFPRNKRKRGERKAGSSNWSRQRPAEPDTE